MPTRRLAARRSLIWWSRTLLLSERRTGASRIALAPCGRGHHRCRQQTGYGEGLVQQAVSPADRTSHPAAFGCHLLPQGELLILFLSAPICGPAPICPHIGDALRDTARSHSPRTRSASLENRTNRLKLPIRKKPYSGRSIIHSAPLTPPRSRRRWQPSKLAVPYGGRSPSAYRRWIRTKSCSYQKPII
jgi:hypothetical protein